MSAGKIGGFLKEAAAKGRQKLPTMSNVEQSMLWKGMVAMNVVWGCVGIGLFYNQQEYDTRLEGKVDTIGLKMDSLGAAVSPIVNVRGPNAT